MRTRTAVATIIAVVTLTGCTVDNGDKPIRARTPEELVRVIDPPVANTPEVQEENKRRQEERDNTNLNLQKLYSQRDRLQACFEVCKDENSLRMERQRDIIAKRQEIRKLCPQIDSSYRFLHVDPTSQRSHDRIVHNDSTGKLEFRSADETVVSVHTPWSQRAVPAACALPDSLATVAAFWMREMPPEDWMIDCYILYSKQVYAELSLDQCSNMIRHYVYRH